MPLISRCRKLDPAVCAVLESMLELVGCCEQRDRRQHWPGVVLLTIGSEQLDPLRGDVAMAQDIVITVPDVVSGTVGNRRSLTPSYTKPDGTPGKVDGLPSYASADETVAAVVDDGGVEYVRFTGVGSCTLEIDADADLGAGKHNITLLLTVISVARPEDEVTGGTVAVGAEEADPLAA